MPHELATQSSRLVRVLRRKHLTPGRRLERILALLPELHPGLEGVLFLPADTRHRFSRLFTANGALLLPATIAPEHLATVIGATPVAWEYHALPPADPVAAWFCHTAAPATFPLATLLPHLTTLAAELRNTGATRGEQLANRLAETAPLAHSDQALPLSRDLPALYRFGRGLQRTLRLNESIHFLLSALTVADGGDFACAGLFLLNERSETLQGMLGVTRSSATLVLPSHLGELAWETPQVSATVQRQQRETPFNTAIIRQRLPLEIDSPLAIAVRQRQPLAVTQPDANDPVGNLLAETLGLRGYACIPLPGGQQPLGALLIGVADGHELTPERLKFLEFFARQAGVAIENVLLLRRLELANNELRETEARVQQDGKMAVLGELVASITHDIKTPLVAIGGFAQRLERIAQDEATRHYAETIARHARRLEEILGGILTFSRKEMICYSTCDPQALLREVLYLEGPLLLQANIGVTVEVAAEPPSLQADPVRLSQLLANLIINARQAMPNGGTLTVRIGQGLLRGLPALVFEVEDSGPGIPEEIQQHIFQPFFTTKPTGTGLGLAICQRIVEQHHGEIKAGNGRSGALFRCTLPLN